MLKFRYDFIWLCLLFVQFGFAQPSEHVIWDRQPLSITLPIGYERLVVFPVRVEVDASQSQLLEAQLRLLNNDGVLYLTAFEHFNQQRLLVRTIDDGKIIVLDINADQQASHSAVHVVWETDDNDTALSKPKELYSVTQLMRWVVQQFFSPERLLAQPPDIHRVEMHTTPMVKLLSSPHVVANPQASWRQGHRYVTAVEVRNISDKTVVLHHPDLLGQWRMSLFYPAMILSPHQEIGDSTMVFLLSYQPFSESMRGR